MHALGQVGTGIRDDWMRIGVLLKVESSTDGLWHHIEEIM